ncbi:MAG: FAD-dependent thymidylate synthase [Methanomassiliicoccales archaeon]|jgi:thymidylate synthase (FAD)|nr:FAD-dependent thymidylate synthase [Methanomassiliicoccales archaeon]
MRVKLLSYTKDAERLCAAAAQSCYSEKPASELLVDIEDNRSGKIISRVVGMGHHSVIEHACYTFSVEGVSRALTHQLVRHRIASYSQQSQRYVSMDRADYVIPPSIAREGELAEEFRKLMDEIWEVYRRLSKKVDVEDARYVLPNACTTNITITMNARELLHFFSLRCCNRAQWEIREVADRMLAEVKKVSPAIFENAGPPCMRGPCPEGKMSCGKPRRDELKRLK